MRYKILMRNFSNSWRKKTLYIAPQGPGYHKWHLRWVAQTSAKLTPGQSNPGVTKTVEATTPELGPVGFLSPKSSSFSGSTSIEVEEASRNIRRLQLSAKLSGAPNFFVQHDRVEHSKLRRYFETSCRALEQLQRRRTSSTTPLASYSKCRTTYW